MQDEGWCYGEAQKATGVPKSTVYNYSKSFVITKKRRGRDTVLTTEEELCLKEKELEDKLGGWKSRKKREPRKI